MYGKGPDDEKHECPTMRLIAQKNTAFDYSKVLNENVQLEKDYSIKYTSQPGKSYIIEPHEGELNYKMAYKKPLQFYEDFFEQEITKHKVKESSPDRKNEVAVSSKVTKRPHMKIMEKIHQKLHEILKKKLGEHNESEIEVALKDKEIDVHRKNMMREDKI